MSRRRSPDIVGVGNPGGEDDESSWLTSYLDVLTLLITLFVLLISISGSGEQNKPDHPASKNSPELVGDERSGVQPRSDGLLPEFDGLSESGVSVDTQESKTTLRINNSLLFESGSVSLKPEGKGLVERLGDKLSRIKGQISVEGHTDNVPISTARFPSNWELSTRRATEVLRRLSRSGVEGSNLRAIGYGSSRPIEANDSPSNRSSNRRVEIVIRK